MVDCDQVIYLRTLEIHQKQREKFGLLEFVAKRLYDTGLRYVAIESEAFIIGFIGRALDGKAHKRTI